MKKSSFDQMGGTYYQRGDYFFPNLSVPESDPIGIWGQRYLHYLKKYRHATYTAMFLSGKLNGYLTKIDQQAEEMFFLLVMQMAEEESITEQLKADSQVEWIGRMNNIRIR